MLILKSNNGRFNDTRKSLLIYDRTQPQRMQLFHKDSILQLCCTHLKVWFGIRTNFARLNFVVHAPPSLCKVLNECDDHAQKVSTDSGSSSKW